MQTLRALPRVSLHLPELVGRARALGVIAGCLVTAAGIAATLDAGLGVGPYDVLGSGVAGRTGLTFGVANLIISTVVCFIGWRLGAKVGFGSLAAVLTIGPLVDGWRLLLPVPAALGWQVVWLLVGLGVLSFGLSLIVAAGLGSGPVEVLMLGLSGRGVPLRWVRTGLEISFCVAGIVLGGQFGVGTIVIALAIGHTLTAFVPREIAR